MQQKSVLSLPCAALSVRHLDALCLGQEIQHPVLKVRSRSQTAILPLIPAVSWYTLPRDQISPLLHRDPSLQVVFCKGTA
jgi:hypothetical protein